MGLFFKKKEVPKEPEQPKEKKPKTITKKYNFNIVGLDQKNENGVKCIKELKDTVKEVFVGEPYMGMTQKDCRESMCSVEYYEGEDFWCECVPYEFEGEPAVKVYMLDLNNEKHHVGWIAANKAGTYIDMMKRMNACDSIVIKGVKVRSAFGTESKDWKPQVEVWYAQMVAD